MGPGQGDEVFPAFIEKSLAGKGSREFIRDSRLMDRQIRRGFGKYPFPGCCSKGGEVGDPEVYIILMTRVLQDLHDFGHIPVGYDTCARLDDAGLLGRDFGQGLPEKFRVLEADVHDTCDLRAVDDVRGVEPPAHADLENDDVALFRPEIEHGNRRRNFELGGVVGHGVRFRGHAGRILRKFVMTNVKPVHTHALAEVSKMRGNVKARPEACRLQDTCRHGAAGPLAVGPGHVDEFEVPLRTAEPCKELSRPSQAEPGFRPPLGFYVGYRFFVSQCCPLPKKQAGYLCIVSDLCLSCKMYTVFKGGQKLSPLLPPRARREQL